MSHVTYIMHIFINHFSQPSLCLTCPEKHAFIRLGPSPLPVCIALTDQSFPPFITANMSESCIAVLRVEDGKLSDLDSLFRAVFRSHVGPAECLPQGSVVMVGSVTHLSLSGLSCYTHRGARQDDQEHLRHSRQRYNCHSGHPDAARRDHMSYVSPPDDDPGLLDSIISAAT